MTTLRPSELQCQRTIVEAARIAGWRVHAERTAMRQSGRYSTPIQGDKGFPDLVLVRDGHTIFAELKRKPNKIDAAQQAWLDQLDATPGITALVVWVPEQQDQFIARLFERAAA